MLSAAQWDVTTVGRHTTGARVDRQHVIGVVTRRQVRAKPDYTVGVNATGPITGARWRRHWKSLITSPPRIWVRARSIRT